MGLWRSGSDPDADSGRRIMETKATTSDDKRIPSYPSAELSADASTYQSVPPSIEAGCKGPKARTGAHGHVCCLISPTGGDVDAPRGLTRADVNA